MDKRPASDAFSVDTSTPRAAGFAMPAEWAPQEAVWLSWPHKEASWPGLFDVIPAKFAEIAATISRFQQVRINLARPLQPGARRLLVEARAALENITFFDHPTNDAWCRDHGPTFVKHRTTGEVALVDWAYNAWGGKYPPFDLDNAIPPSIATALNKRRFVKDIIMEGGSIDVNGAGTVLTTSACLLNPNRNPSLSKAEIERALSDYLNVDQILWLGDGIIGDDTDGHVDDITRFFREDGIITVVEPDTSDPNHELLQANVDLLHGWRTPAGKKFDIVELPMPSPLAYEGQRVPASYANFLIINGAVLVPVFNQPQDGRALEIIRGCFPGREVIGIDCSTLIWGLGTLHCISQQQPA